MGSVQRLRQNPPVRCQALFKDQESSPEEMQTHCGDAKEYLRREMEGSSDKGRGLQDDV